MRKPYVIHARIKNNLLLRRILQRAATVNATSIRSSGSVKPYYPLLCGFT
jgi:hypothetical protein